MRRAKKGRQITWYEIGIVTMTLLIGGAASAISQQKVDGSSRSITLPPLASGIAGSIPESINVGGVTRTYRLYVPRTFRSGNSALLIGLHGRGAGGPGSAMEQYSGLDFKADQEGFALDVGCRVAAVEEGYQRQSRERGDHGTEKAIRRATVPDDRRRRSPPEPTVESNGRLGRSSNSPVLMCG